MLALGLSQPAAAATGDFDDRWLSQAILDELADAAKDGKYADLEHRTAALIFERLQCGHPDKLAALNDMVYVLRASRYLPMAEKLKDGGKFSAWLVANRDLSRLLFRAMQDLSDRKSPQDAIKDLYSLASADQGRVLAYANLAVAFATSLPLEHYVKQPRPATMQESFDWYTNPKGRFRFDLKAMPFELSRFLADTRASIAERQWAAQKYANHQDLAATWLDVKFDSDYFFHGAPKKITRAEYTLNDLDRCGGICLDQSYFAAEVCKAMGMPASLVHGRNFRGDGHAWLACFRARVEGGQRTLEWDVQTGRYDEQKYYSGTLTDPATGARINDCELMLLGAAALLPLDRREETDAAVALAAMVANAVKPSLAPASNPATRPSSVPEGVEDLRRLAQDHNRRLAEHKAAVEADLQSIKPIRKIDMALVEDLLTAAAKANLANKGVWELAIELRKAGALSTEATDRLFDLLITRTAREYPEYSCRLAMRIVPTYDAARREGIYLKCIAVYQRRPDLQGYLMVALADELGSQGKRDAALKAYQQVITGKTRSLTEVFLTAVTHADAFFLSEGRRDQAIQMYRQLFSEARKPAPTNYCFRQSMYYQLGERLAELLDDDGQKDAAKQVRSDIGLKGEPAGKD
ncbi:MAG: hypothetical protein ACE15C_19935 [Phycisphaerae bacterium]